MVLSVARGIVLSLLRYLQLGKSGRLSEVTLLRGDGNLGKIFM